MNHAAPVRLRDVQGQRGVAQLVPGGFPFAASDRDANAAGRERLAARQIEGVVENAHQPLGVS